MGVKIIALDDTDISVILTGLSLAHNKYYTNKDKESMLLSDKLIDLIKDGNVYIGEVKKRWMKDLKISLFF